MNMHNEYYSARTESEIGPCAATWVVLEIIILSAISQKEKDKYHMISLCGILKNDKNKLICRIGTDTRHREQAWLSKKKLGGGLN